MLIGLPAASSLLKVLWFQPRAVAIGIPAMPDRARRARTSRWTRVSKSSTSGSTDPAASVESHSSLHMSVSSTFAHRCTVLRYRQRHTPLLASRQVVSAALA